MYDVDIPQAIAEEYRELAESSNQMRQAKEKHNITATTEDSIEFGKVIVISKEKPFYRFSIAPLVTKILREYNPTCE